MPNIRGRILIIDDDKDLLMTLQQLISDCHDVVALSDAREALALVTKDSDFHAIVCDLMMPHLGGVDFYSKLKEECPKLCSRTIFLTGGSITKKTTDFLAQPEIQSLEKPIQLEELLHQLQTIVQANDVFIKKVI